MPIEEIKEALWPRVDLSVVFPKSLTCEEVGAPGFKTTNHLLVETCLGLLQIANLIGPIAVPVSLLQHDHARFLNGENEIFLT